MVDTTVSNVDRAAGTRTRRRGGHNGFNATLTHNKLSNIQKKNLLNIVLIFNKAEKLERLEDL